MTDSRTGRGLLFALVSAMSFALSGTFATTLMEAGWSPAAAVTLRATVGGIVLLPLAAISLHGRWDRLARAWKTVVAYGLIAVALCQLFFFLAVELMPVGVALLVEYTSPLGLLVWLWLAHGQRPGRLTVLGAAVAVIGLVLVIDVVGGLSVSPIGLMWSILAMLGGIVYFVLSADDSHGLPPIALSGFGLLAGAGFLWLFGLTGLFSLRFATADVTMAHRTWPWWVPVVALGVLCAAIAYSTGIEAARCLGSRLASFLALLELLFAFAFAWFLVGQVPTVLQAIGGATILAGVVLVKLGEPREAPGDFPLDDDGIPVV